MMDPDIEERENDDRALTSTRKEVPQAPSAFNRLPVGVIQKILYTVDANTFASLTVLNRQWRKASSNTELYAYHLSRCPLHAVFQGSVSSSPTEPHDLNQLKRRFAREVRKNAFQLFLRPHKTLVTLISSSVGPSVGLPTGEALKFVFSANGHILLCLSSSRIFVLDLAAPEIKVLYELKTSRMPLAATILDDGRVLAVVSHRHQVNIYHLSKREAKHVQVLTLNDVPRALAFAPTGSVLAIAYDGSIEVHALGENVDAHQCRAVRCGKIDTLSFSLDGSLLLGSSLGQPNGGFVTITAPFPTDSIVDTINYEAHSWTTQILFPDIISGYSHVTLLSSQVYGVDDWVIGFDDHLKTFRTVRRNDSMTGSAYFPGPVSPDSMEEYMPSLSPAVDSNGELVALAFRDGGLWLYGLPDDLNSRPIESNGMMGVNGNGLLIQSSSHFQSPSHDGTTASQLERDLNQPSLMIKGRKVADIPGLTAARWVARQRLEENNNSMRQRLVAVAPGGVASSSLGNETIPVDGGRISIFDFQLSAGDGETVELTIELGEEEPLILREPDANLEQEVELERRRTQLRRGASHRLRADPGESMNIPQPSLPDTSDHHRSISSSSPILGAEVTDVTLFLEGPYSNTAPRSRDTLRRAATAAASNRVSQYQAEHVRTILPPLHIPHESDADNWVPPPPPYTRNADQPLPEHLQRLLLPPMTAPPDGAMDEIPEQMRRASTNQDDRPGRLARRVSYSMLSRRWSTRRRTTDITNAATTTHRMSFRPLTFYRTLHPSADNSELQPQSLNTQNQNIPTPRVALHQPPSRGSDRASSTVPRQTVRQLPSDSGTLTTSSTVRRRQFRNNRIFSNFRKSSNELPSSQGANNSSTNGNSNSDRQRQDLPNPSLRRHISIMRFRGISRSSPNLASARNSTVNRMSTIYSNASRPSDQNGQIYRSRSRSDVGQTPARLTEEALQHAIELQGVDVRRHSRNLQPQVMAMHIEEQPPLPQPQQYQQRIHLQQPSPPGAGDDWQYPDPTESQEWRARIEAWNMDTINERKRSKSKTARCIVM